MNNKIYIAGKVSGEAHYEVRFRAAELLLIGEGWRVVNPVKACKKDWSWLRCMAKCLTLLMGCGSVAMLAGWETSRGAQIEHWVAQKSGKNVRYLRSNL